ncbi:MAG: hypothetical protein WB496_11770, partial [Pseudolabrys sp.]
SNIVAKSQSAKAKIAKAFAARAVRNHVRFRPESRPSASASCMSALVSQSNAHVRFTPESGHLRMRPKCLPSAK